MGTQPSTSMSFNRPLNLHSSNVGPNESLGKPEHRRGAKMSNSAKVHHQVLGLQVLGLALLGYWPRTQASPLAMPPRSQVDETLRMEPGYYEEDGASAGLAGWTTTLQSGESRTVT